MSLITLTFGNDHNYAKGDYRLRNTGVKKPNSPRKTGTTAKTKVLKTDEFYGTEGTFVISKLVEGCVYAGMESNLNGTPIEISELDSKYGNGAISRPGANVGITIHGASKNDFENGQIIEWTAKPEAPKDEAKKHGKWIIC